MSPLPIGSKPMMCSRLVRTTRPIATMSMLRMVSRITAKASCPTFPSGTRPDEVTRVDARLRHKLIDVDRSGGFERNVFQLVLRHLDVGVGIYLVAFDDVVVRNFLARVGVNLGVFDPVTGLLIDLVEADLFGIGSGRVQSDRAGDEGKAQKAFPVGTGGHWVLQTQRELVLKDEFGPFVPTIKFQKV